MWKDMRESWKKLDTEVSGKRPKEFYDPGRECPNCGGVMKRKKVGIDSYCLLKPPTAEDYWVCGRCDYQEE